MISNALIFDVFMCSVVILCCSVSLNGYPHALIQKRAIISDKEQEYLMKFGYLSSNVEGAGALRTEESVRHALKDLQRFARIPETGEMDPRTIELMSMPRCGVRDFDPTSLAAASSTGGNGGVTRRKRYVLHTGHPWHHTNLTWSLRTKDATSVNLGEAEQVFARALDVWARNSRLTFTRVDDTRADILIYFHRGEHGDLFPFDGKGQILAHAFFPGAGKGGDAHFDMDEIWITNDRDDDAEGTDLFKVAAHEFGHSLGLAHSNEDGALMSPWYQGSSKGTDYQLPEDDRQAIQSLYGSKPDYRYYTTTTTTTTTTRPPYAYDPYYHPYDNPKRPHYPNYYPHNPPYHPRYPTTEKPRKPMHPWKKHPYPKDPDKYPGRYTTKSPRWYNPRERYPPTVRPYYPSTTTTTTTTTTRRPPIRHYPDHHPKPDVCNTSFDAVAVIRREVFFFKDAYFWRIGENGLLPGHPALITRMWSSLPRNLTHVDAVYETPDNKIVFFIGREYFVFIGNTLERGYPRSLVALGLPDYLKRIDGATVWGHNSKTFFFSGNSYWRFDEDSKKVELDYPRNISMWRGVGDHIDAVFQWRDGKTYFFKGKGFWKFDDIHMQVEHEYQKLSGPFWFSCTHNFEENHSRKEPRVAEEPISASDSAKCNYYTLIFAALAVLYRYATATS